MSKSPNHSTLLLTLCAVANLPTQAVALACEQFPPSDECFKLPSGSTTGSTPPVISTSFVGSGESLLNVSITATGVLSQVALGGQVHNSGLIKDVKLLPGASIQGGTLSGRITGSTTPALLSAVNLTGATLSQVLLDNRCTLDATTQIGPGVYFAAESSIPDGANLSAAGQRQQDSSANIQLNALDLSRDVAGQRSWLQQIQELPALQAATLQQTPEGILSVSLGQTTYTLAAVQVTKARAGTQAGIAFSADGLLQLNTLGQRTLLLAATLADRAGWDKALAAMGLHLDSVTSPYGTLRVSDAQKTQAYVLRPELTAEVASLTSAPGIYLRPYLSNRLPNINIVQYTFKDAQGSLRQQLLPPMPADWDALRAYLQQLNLSAISLSSDGILRATTPDGQVLQAIMGYAVVPGNVSANSLRLDSSTGDLNQDGIPDLTVVYANGERQALILIPAAPTPVPTTPNQIYVMQTLDDVAAVEQFLQAQQQPVTVDINLGGKDYPNADISFKNFSAGDKIRFNRADGSVQPGNGVLHSATDNQYFSSLNTANIQRSDAIVHAGSQSEITLKSALLDVAKANTRTHTLQIHLTSGLQNKNLHFEFF